MRLEDYEDIEQIQTIWDSFAEVNKHLKEGWILLDFGVVQKKELMRKDVVIRHFGYNPNDLKEVVYEYPNSFYYVMGKLKQEPKS